jgi:hypothetical protein
MRTKATWPRRALGVLSVLSLHTLAPSPCMAGQGVHIEPESIHIGTFYAPREVEVSARIPEGCDAVIEVLGKDIEEQLLRKGQHWDIWMNVGEIDIEGAPCVYLAMSSNPESLSATAPAPAFGYGVLERRASFLGDVTGLDHLEIFDEFVKLKESEKLYRLDPGALRLEPAPGGSTAVHGAFTIPSRIPPGTYRVLLSVLEDGRVVESSSTSLGVEIVGLPALLSSLARRHGAFHGLLAVTVAVVFGFLTGVVFTKARACSRKDGPGVAASERKQGA